MAAGYRAVSAAGALLVVATVFLLVSQREHESELSSAQWTAVNEETDSHRGQWRQALQAQALQRSGIAQFLKSNDVRLVADVPTPLGEAPDQDQDEGAAETSNDFQPQLNITRWAKLDGKEMKHLLARLNSTDSDSVSADVAKHMLQVKGIKPINAKEDSVETLREEVVKRREKLAKVEALCGDAEACGALHAEAQEQFRHEHKELADALEDPDMRKELASAIKGDLEKARGGRPEDVTEARNHINQQAAKLRREKLKQDSEKQAAEEAAEEQAAVKTEKQEAAGQKVHGKNTPDKAEKSKKHKHSTKKQTTKAREVVHHKVHSGKKHVKQEEAHEHHDKQQAHEDHHRDARRGALDSVLERQHLINEAHKEHIKPSNPEGVSDDPGLTGSDAEEIDKLLKKDDGSKHTDDDDDDDDSASEDDDDHGDDWQTLDSDQAFAIDEPLTSPIAAEVLLQKPSRPPKEAAPEVASAARLEAEAQLEHQMARAEVLLARNPPLQQQAPASSTPSAPSAPGDRATAALHVAKPQHAVETRLSIQEKEMHAKRRNVAVLAARAHAVNEAATTLKSKLKAQVKAMAHAQGQLGTRQDIVTAFKRVVKRRQKAAAELAAAQRSQMQDVEHDLERTHDTTTPL